MNNILNKIAQMERNAEEIQLASHHVELGLIDDLQKLYDAYSKTAIDAIQVKTKLQSEAKILADKLQKAKDAKDEAVKKADNVTAAAKNIGIDIPEIVSKVNNSGNFQIERLLEWSKNAAK